MKNKKISVLLTASVLFMFFGCVSANHRPGNSASNDQGKIPVIIDTDMGFDDWMAVLYLLNKSDIDIKAITVDCAGETLCPFGAVNATKLLKLAGKPDIPVFFGEAPPSTLLYQFPPVIRKSATAMDVPGFNDIPGTKNYYGEAAAHMVTLALQAVETKTPLTIISIGTSTNIAQAVQQSKDKGLFGHFAKGIKMVYKGGGAVGEAVNGFLTNKNIHGNLSIPDIFSSENKSAEWNIYANASGTETLSVSGLPITLIPVNLSDQVNITKQSYKDLKETAKTASAKFVVSDIKVNVDSQGGWDKVELDYWDPSVAVAALSPGFITKKYSGVQSCVETNKGDAHGTTYVNTPLGSSSKCKEINLEAGTIFVYTAIDTDKFYKDFTNTLNK